MSNLNKFYNNREYKYIISDILDNDKFLAIKNCKHHGITRFEHSMRVSYYSYIITKKLHLNYTATARGGLLHDFFVQEDLTVRKQKLSMFFHPYKALDNSCNIFNVSDIEQDIIINHMFPTLPHKIPKYIESWIVSFVDKAVAIYEFYYSYGRSFVYRFSNLYVMLLLLARR